MPLFDIIVLTAIVAVFIVFGVVLASVCWYCSDKRKRASGGAAARDYGFPPGRLITDDD